MSSSTALLPDDTVSRSILDPKDYIAGGVLNLRNSFEFPSNDGSCESVNCHRLVNYEIPRIHALGLDKQIADRDRGKNTTYMGYIEAIVKRITDLQVEDYHFTVYPVTDPNNPAHCHIHLHFTAKQKAKRNALLEKLFDCFSALNAVPPNQAIAMTAAATTADPSAVATPIPSPPNT